MIVKAELYILPGDDNVQVRVHDKDREYEWSGKCPEAFENEFGTDTIKYFHAELEPVNFIGDGVFIIGKVAEKQDW